MSAKTNGTRYKIVCPNDVGSCEYDITIHPMDDVLDVNVKMATTDLRLGRGKPTVSFHGLSMRMPVDTTPEDMYQGLNALNRRENSNMRGDLLRDIQHFFTGKGSHSYVVFEQVESEARLSLREGS